MFESRLLNQEEALHYLGGNGNRIAKRTARSERASAVRRPARQRQRNISRVQDRICARRSSVGPLQNQITAGQSDPGDDRMRWCPPGHHQIQTAGAIDLQ